MNKKKAFKSIELLSKKKVNNLIFNFKHTINFVQSAYYIYTDTFAADDSVSVVQTTMMLSEVQFAFVCLLLLFIHLIEIDDLRSKNLSQNENLKSSIYFNITNLRNLEQNERHQEEKCVQSFCS